MKPKVKAESAAILERHKWSLIITILISFMILIFVGTTRAGKVIDKDSEKKSSSESKKSTSVSYSYEIKSPKDKAAAEIAEEYAYLLEQLLYLSSDYCRYFGDLKNETGLENYKALAQMCERISKKGRYENIGKITKEIQELKKELVDRERELAQIQAELGRESAERSKANTNLRALKLTSTLREELESLDEQIERDVVWRIEKSNYDSEAIQKYVTAIINDSLIQYVSGIGTAYAPVIEIRNGQNGKTTAVVVEAPTIPEIGTIVIPDVPEPEHTHTPPAMPDRAATPTSHFKGVTYVRNFSDSLPISSKDIDINIINGIGNVIVSSSKNNFVYTNYSIGISADNQEISEKIGQEIHLRLYPKADKIYIESVVPKINDRTASIDQSNLEVFLPQKNKVAVSNSNGNVELKDLNNNVYVNSSSGNIDIYRLNGDLALINSSGSVSLSKVDGNMKLQNKMGPIKLFRCEGTMEVVNTLGEIAFEDCQGEAIIRNTGPINVVNHTGSVEINNRNGQITVDNINGNLAVINSFELITLSNVNGDAKVVNANAPITVQQVTGLATVNNRFGNITGIGLNGPIVFENKSGDIMLELSRPLSGESSIVSYGGDVIISVSSTNNLLIDMESIGGKIDIAGYDAKVNSNNPGILTAKLTLGKAQNKLGVKTTGSKITLDRAH